MTIDRIRELYGAKPFRPFTIHLADGREISVRHQEFMALGPGGRTVVVFHDDDSLNIIDLLLVTDIEIGRNGHRKKK